MRPMMNRVKKVEKDFNKKMSLKSKKISFTEKDVREVKQLCLNFKRIFESNSHIKFIDESEIIIPPGSYDNCMSEELKKLGYIWFKNLANVFSSCVIGDLWNQVEKAPELKDLMYFRR
jgi:hypothetical protein